MMEQDHPLAEADGARGVGEDKEAGRSGPGRPGTVSAPNAAIACRTSAGNPVTR
ncbi:MAG: hypothetical protein U9P14_04335 [Gemmatimonadota bacterium]|nr:hypothetical protein [Gemmatimonadota bacterium]